MRIVTRLVSSGWAWVDQHGEVHQLRPSGLDTTGVLWLPGEASRLAALLLPQIQPVFSVVAPCHPGAALRNPQHTCRVRATSDIRIVAPFNAHVARITKQFEILNSQVEIPPAGTVDEFQGQEAPVIIYSIASSTPADAPRGMEFLYSLNRLNVATSRAQCAVIVVASPALFQPECQTPRQMALANGMATYAEMAIRATVMR